MPSVWANSPVAGPSRAGPSKSSPSRAGPSRSWTSMCNHPLETRLLTWHCHVFIVLFSPLYLSLIFPYLAIPLLSSLVNLCCLVLNLHSIVYIYIDFSPVPLHLLQLLLPQFCNRIFLYGLYLLFNLLVYAHILHVLFVSRSLRTRHAPSNYLHSPSPPHFVVIRRILELRMVDCGLSSLLYCALYL